MSWSRTAQGLQGSVSLAVSWAPRGLRIWSWLLPLQTRPAPSPPPTALHRSLPLKGSPLPDNGRNKKVPLKFKVWNREKYVWGKESSLNSSWFCVLIHEHYSVNHSVNYSVIKIVGLMSACMCMKGISFSLITYILPNFREISFLDRRQ